MVFNKGSHALRSGPRQHWQPRRRHPLRKPTRTSIRERGAMLIIAMGVLTLLAVLGTTFVSLMRLEKKATLNYIDAQVVDLINESALDRIIADLRGLSNHLSYSSYSRTPWLFKLKNRDRLGQGMVDIESPEVGNWDILASDKARVMRYKTKVIDTSTQININGQQDTTARMLENLCNAIVRSPDLRKGDAYPLYTGPKQTGDRLKGSDIMRFRNTLESHRFRTKTQIRDLIGQENFDTIKDFITVHSWEDPFTYKPTDGLEEVVEFGASSGTGGGGAGLGGGGASNSHPEAVSPNSRVAPEPRSPININLAPEEVLIATLMGVGGRRPFPYSRIVYGQIDGGADIRGDRIPGTEELENLLPRAVWVYSPRLEYEHAQKIARRIIQNRKTTARQFMTWSSGEAGRPGYAEFINDLDESFFPNPELAVIIDPVNPRDRRAQQDLKGGTEIANMWRRGHDSRERAFRRQYGKPFHSRNAFYYELVKAAVIANANPNSRLNRHNSNVPAHTAVDKSDLVVLDEADRQTPRYGYTTEFTFDSTGVFEVTTLAQIAQRQTDNDAPGGGSSVSPGIRSRRDDLGLTPLYEKKMRSVVKVFDVLRHTNQFHFEKTFRAGSFSSRNDRRNVVTWPEPFVALTDAVTAGSIRDGRVELAGMQDSVRLQVPPSSRQQLYQSPAAISMAHGFQDRTDQSYSQLKRLAQSGGGLGSPEFNRQIRDILNANFSRTRAPNREYYAREDLIARGSYQGGSAAEINLDPNVNTSGLGNDLAPDGLHTSVFTMTHLGGRFLYLPAHGNMVTPTGGKGGRAAQVGAAFASDSAGNVPYYQGGVAFWVKFEFDGLDPVFSGLVGCTQVVEDVASAPTDYKGSEGQQFYIFKNTKGQLRVVRMYYHECFQDLGGDGGEGGGGGGGETGDTSTLVPQLGELAQSEGGAQQVQAYLDQRKLIARSDVLVDISHFKAHEWHHLAVDWHDENPGQPLTVWIDFERIQTPPYVPQEDIQDVPTAWVRLNVRRPRDGLFIGGFIRKQKVSDSGVFKWYSNTFRPNQGSATVIERPLKRVIANATIDEFIAYSGTFSSVRRYFAPRGAPGYFTNQPGTYANVFEIPLPPEIEHVVMRSFDWTSYYPTFYTGGGASIRAPVNLRVEQIRGQAQLGGKVNPSGLSEGWRTPMTRTAVSNRPCVRRQSRGLLGRNAELAYKFTIPPGITQTGTLAGGAMQTPAIDDVTATYYLPDPKILHQEELD